MHTPVDDAASPRHTALLTDVLRSLAEQLDATPVDAQALAAVDELVQAAKAEIHRLRQDPRSPVMAPPAHVLGPGVLAELIKRSRDPRETTSESVVDARR